MTSDEMVVDVSKDRALACEVQQRFMQSLGRTSDSIDFSARCRQLRTIGGDCYNFTPFADDSVALVVGDASGKSLAAALMMAVVQSSLRTAALLIGNDFATLFKIVNQQAYMASLTDRLVTLFYGVFDGATRILRYVNAGHNPPVVLRRDRSTEWLETGGAPVGLFPDSSYAEGIVHLHPGDLVITYTDGVIEAANLYGEEWGVQGLLNAAAAWEPHSTKGTEDLVQSIFNSMDDFAKGGQTDDATLAILRVI